VPDPNIDRIDKEVEEALAQARREDSKRREMSSGQIKQTRWGPVKFRLYVDLPKAVPEDDFKEIMAEYGGIIREAFSAK
jgi:hypothetical protein